jgi:hypothetical protein
MVRRHASALLARDERQWKADLDTSPAAARFTQHQREVFTNLARVPLATWRYDHVTAVSNPDVLSAAAGRLAGRVVVLRVRFEYALALVDPKPTGQDLLLTAVLRPAGWLLAGQSDVTGVGDQSWWGPWDFGPLLVLARPHTLVLAHPSHAADMETFSSAVERSVRVVNRVWGSGWNDHVAVLIPDTPAEFEAEVKGLGESQNLAAAAVADRVTPDHVVVGARIVINPVNLSKLVGADRQVVLQHEVMHVAARADTSDQMPSWVVEGFADYAGYLDSGQPVATAAAELAAEIRAGQVPMRLPTDTDFSGSNTRLSQVYQQAWLACRLIARRDGERGLVRFYKTVNAIAAAGKPGTSVPVALRQVMHLDLASFTALWRTNLIAELP